MADSGHHFAPDDRSGAKPTLFQALDAQATAVLDAIDAMLETLREKAAHPQDFGVEGCPACKVQDVLGEASLAVQEASARIREWQPEAKAE